MGRISMPRFSSTARWALVIAVTAVIFVASVVETAGPSRGPVGDKSLHVLGYAALGLAIAYATLHWKRVPDRAVAVVGGSVSYGLAIELVQAPLPYRTFSTLDLMADGAGAALALLWLVVERVRDVDVSGESGR